MNRKIVMDLGAIYKLGSDEKTFQAIKKAGFKYYDYSLFWKGTTEHIGTGPDFREKALGVKKLADSYGLKCEQAHAYFTAGVSPESIQTRIDYIQKDIEIAAILGAKCIVIHPIVEYSIEENVEFIKKHYLPLAHKFNIKLAIENVWKVVDDKPAPMCTSTPENFVKFIDAFNDPYIVACLDLGHAEMVQMGTSAVDMIRALKHRIYCLHIHDNNTYADQHQIPYTYDIDFNTILEALKEVDYKGNITFEAETVYFCGWNEKKSLPLDLYVPFLKLEYEIGKYFKNYLDKS